MAQERIKPEELRKAVETLLLIAVGYIYDETGVVDRKGQPLPKADRTLKLLRKAIESVDALREHYEREVHRPARISHDFADTVVTFYEARDAGPVDMESWRSTLSSLWRAISGDELVDTELDYLMGPNEPGDGGKVMRAADRVGTLVDRCDRTITNDRKHPPPVSRYFRPVPMGDADSRTATLMYVLRDILGYSVEETLDIVGFVSRRYGRRRHRVNCP